VIYESNWRPEDTIFRILLFKIFNRIETWQQLEEALGPLTFKSYRFEHYDAVLSGIRSRGEPIYSAAYIMPPPRSFQSNSKHAGHLRLLETIMTDGLPRHLALAASLEEVYERLRSYPGIGDFLAFQYAIDLNYSDLIDFSEDQFVVAGPGAKDGITKCFSETGDASAAGIIRSLYERQEDEFKRVGLEPVSLWGRRIQLIDIQNLLCEVSKYARVAHPNVPGHLNRKRIKQVYRPGPRLDLPWFPPKWGLNDHITRWSAQEYAGL
jgi:hypothetical protein